jgi:hypothetical protein
VAFNLSSRFSLLIMLTCAHFIMTIVIQALSCSVKVISELCKQICLCSIMSCDSLMYTITASSLLGFDVSI